MFGKGQAAWKVDEMEVEMEMEMEMEMRRDLKNKEANVLMKGRKR